MNADARTSEKLRIPGGLIKCERQKRSLLQVQFVNSRSAIDNTASSMLGAHLFSSFRFSFSQTKLWNQEAVYLENNQSVSYPAVKHCFVVVRSLLFVLFLMLRLPFNVLVGSVVRRNRNCWKSAMTKRLLGVKSGSSQVADGNWEVDRVEISFLTSNIGSQYYVTWKL